MSNPAVVKRLTYIIIGLLLLVVLGGLLLWTTHGSGQLVSLAVVMNSINQASNRMIFRMRTDRHGAIILTDLIVETNSAAGWQACGHNQPTNWLGINARATKDLEVAPPDDGQRWRLRVAYGTEVQGPMLLLEKAEFAISQHRWPGKGFGVMQGSNSCISGEIAK